MVFGLLKKSGRRLLMPYLSQQKLTVVSVLQKGYLLDFIHGVEGKSLSCLFDFTYVLHPGALIRSVEFQCGDKTVVLSDVLVAKRKLLVNLFGGQPDSRSTVVLKLLTDSGSQQEFTILLDVVSKAKKRFDETRHLRPARLWVSDRNPDQDQRQEDGTHWIEGDMILNANDLQIWRYCPDERSGWVKTCLLKGLVGPVPISYNLLNESAVASSAMDGREKRSVSRKDLEVQGEIIAQKVVSRAFVSGDPLGKGISIVTDGMISGQSLYIGSEQAKPKNMFIGCNGVISTRHLSADFLQLSLFSVEELPKGVPLGTLVLCRNYPEYGSAVLIYAIKDQPASLSDWCVLYDRNQMVQGDRNVVDKKPSLSLVPSGVDDRLDTDKVVEIRPNLEKKKKVFSHSEESTHSLNDRYIRLFSDSVSVSSFGQEKLVWDPLILNESVLSRAVPHDWKNDHQVWQVPVTGLLRVNGWLVFTEEEIDWEGPIPYHAGDRFYLDVVKDNEGSLQIFSMNQMEFPLVPYVNDITNRVCPNQRIAFSFACPVQERDRLVFKVAYFHQKDLLDCQISLKIKKIVLELSIS